MSARLNNIFYPLYHMNNFLSFAQPRKFTHAL